jgi:hypothetical protein
VSPEFGVDVTDDSGRAGVASSGATASSNEQACAPRPLTIGRTRVNHVVEFVEGRRSAWLPAEPGQPPPGHLWRWQLDPRGDDETFVVHTYDWSLLTDPRRLVRARDTGVERLQASLDRLNALAESAAASVRHRVRARNSRGTV